MCVFEPVGGKSPPELTFRSVVVLPAPVTRLQCVVHEVLDLLAYFLWDVIGDIGLGRRQEGELVELPRVAATAVACRDNCDIGRGESRRKGSQCRFAAARAVETILAVLFEKVRDCRS